MGAGRRRPPTCFISLLEGTLCLNTVGGVSDTFPAPQDSTYQWPKTPHGSILFACADPIRYEMLQPLHIFYIFYKGAPVNGWSGVRAERRLHHGLMRPWVARTLSGIVCMFTAIQASTRQKSGLTTTRCSAHQHRFSSDEHPKLRL
jgi:hypothetical protein